MFNILIGEKCLEKSRHRDHREGRKEDIKISVREATALCEEGSSSPNTGSAQPTPELSLCPAAELGPAPLSIPALRFQCQHLLGAARDTLALPAQPHAPDRHHSKSFGVFCLFVLYKLLGEKKIPPFDPIKGLIFPTT